MTDDRRATLLALVELAQSSAPGSCWDGQRAADLLRSQSTAEELRELGVSAAVVEHLFGGDDER